MTPLTLQEICQAVGGKPSSPLPSAATVTQVVTDSKQVTPRCLFIALRGERFDGHSFLADVAKSGAIAAIVEEIPAAPDPRLSYIFVPNTRLALGMLASHARSALRGKVIAVLGSNGKTSTKCLIDTVLQTTLRGSASPKSFNNDIGVPLTILPALVDQDFLVLELGTNHHGEIAWLGKISRPDIAVITNCTAEHLEGLTDLNGVRKENTSILASLEPHSVLIINGDDRDLLESTKYHKGRTITFGFDPSNDLFADQCAMDATGTRFKLNSELELFVPLLGPHAALNAMAAIAVARVMGVSDVAIAGGLSHAQGANMRLQLQKMGSITILNDAYNANPASMLAAIQTLSALPTAGRRVAVLGDMLELGEWTTPFHEQIGQAVGKSGIDKLICVGQEGTKVAGAAIATGFPAASIERYVSTDHATQIAANLREGDLVLLKGSRGIALEKVAAAIEDLLTVAKN